MLGILKCSKIGLEVSKLKRCGQGRGRLADESIASKADKHVSGSHEDSKEMMNQGMIISLCRVIKDRSAGFVL